MAVDAAVFNPHTRRHPPKKGGTWVIRGVYGRHSCGAATDAELRESRVRVVAANYTWVMLQRRRRGRVFRISLIDFLEEYIEEVKEAWS